MQVQQNKEFNITFYFQNNTAGSHGKNCKELGRYGHSIIICNSTILPCYDSKNNAGKSPHSIALPHSYLKMKDIYLRKRNQNRRAKT